MKMLEISIVVAILVTFAGAAYYIAQRTFKVPMVPQDFTLLWQQGLVFVIADSSDGENITKIGGKTHAFALKHEYVLREDGVKIVFPKSVDFCLKGRGWGRDNPGTDFPRRWWWKIRQ